MQYCDDTEEGKCILIGGTCSGFAALGAITETLIDGDLVIRSCDRAVVAQRMDLEAQRAARQAAATVEM